jgi:glycosyltransferase involved in cell wall biosynthesis
MEVEDHLVASSFTRAALSTESRTATFALFAYNQERYIREAVEAALAQACEPMEIVLSDDASTDRTFEIIRGIAAGYQGPHTLKLNRNSANLGIAAHVNKVFGMASGNIVLLAAGDDISLPSRVSDTIAAFRRYPHVAMVSFVDDVIDSEGLTLVRGEASSVETSFGLSEFLDEGPLAQRKMKISGASRAILKSTFQSFGDLIPACPAEDTPLILRSLYVGQGLVCQWPGIRYRQHPHQLSGVRSITRMDSAIFTKQYLLDLAVARQSGLLRGSMVHKVGRWIDERDLSFRLRRVEFEGERPTLGILWRVLKSARMSAREKSGLCKRYVLQSRLVGWLPWGRL